MKLLELEIENFGRFSDERLQLGQSGFQLIYGPNEAGKSTLLQLIRELLFGFRHQNPYAWDRHAGEMAATACVELADGRRVRFFRLGNREAQVNQRGGACGCQGEQHNVAHPRARPTGLGVHLAPLVDGGPW